MSNSRRSIANEQDLALPQTQFEVKLVVLGDDGLEYAYLDWARYYLPIRFPPHMDPMRPYILKRIGEPGTSEQLETLAYDLFREIDTNDDERAEWEEITSFLDGAQIAYDKTALKAECFDVNDDGKLSLNEFIEVYKRGLISNVFCIATTGRQHIPLRPDFELGSRPEQATHLDRDIARVAEEVRSKVVLKSGWV